MSVVRFRPWPPFKSATYSINRVSGFSANSDFIILPVAFASASLAFTIVSVCSINPSSSFWASGLMISWRASYKSGAAAEIIRLGGGLDKVNEQIRGQAIIRNYRMVVNGDLR